MSNGAPPVRLAALLRTAPNAVCSASEANRLQRRATVISSWLISAQQAASSENAYATQRIQACPSNVRANTSRTGHPTGTWVKW